MYFEMLHANGPQPSHVKKMLAVFRNILGQQIPVACKKINYQSYTGSEKIEMLSKSITGLAMIRLLEYRRQAGYIGGTAYQNKPWIRLLLGTKLRSIREHC